MPAPTASIASGRPLIEPLLCPLSSTKSTRFAGSPWTPAKFGVTASIVTEGLQVSPNTTTRDERLYDLHEPMPHVWPIREAKRERFERVGREEQIDEGYQASDEVDDEEDECNQGAVQYDDKIDRPHSYCEYEESMPMKEDLYMNEDLAPSSSHGASPSFPNMRSHFSDTSASESSDTPAEEGSLPAPTTPEKIVRRRIRTGSTPSLPTCPQKRKRIIVITDDSEAEEEEHFKKRKVRNLERAVRASSSGSDGEDGEMMVDKPKTKLPRKRMTAPRRVNKFMFW